MIDILTPWIEAGSSRKILLLRHGEIQGAKDGKRFIGQTDVPLSDRGRRQAKWWRQWLASVPLERIITSDLTRCTETAGIIAADRLIPVEASTGFREILLGGWDGMTFRRIKQRWPDAFDRRGSDLAGFRPPGGESFHDLQQRVVPVFEETVNRAAGPILIVAHAGVNRVIICHILKIALDNLFGIAQSYGGLNLIDHDNGRYCVQSLNLPAVADAIACEDR